MNWASDLFVVLLLTDLTGTIFLIVGVLFRKPADEDVVFLRFLTKATLYAYLVPFVYVILYLGRRISTDKMKSHIILFYNTPFTMKLNAFLGCIWVGLFLVLLAQRLYRYCRLVRMCRGNIPEEDEEIFRIFRETCAELGIDGRVSLCRNDLVRMPCMTYHRGYIVILPLKRYTEQEARVIFCHELCHYLNRDLYVKTIGSIAALLHVFNPAVHILFGQLDLLCERCCDREACKKGKDRFTVQEYFETIFRLLVNEGKNDKYQLFALADNKSNYERRVAYMTEYRKSGGLKKRSALVLAACFLLGSSITALAAGDGVTELYRGLTEESSAKDVYGESDVTPADQEVVEVLARAYDLDPGKVTVMDDEAEPFGLIKYVYWTVPPGETYVSGEFWQVKGDEICVTVQATPEEIEYQMGIQDPKAYMWYVEGSGHIHQDFVINISGFQSFFVTNLSETEDLDITAVIMRPEGSIF